VIDRQPGQAANWRGRSPGEASPYSLAKALAEEAERPGHPLVEHRASDPQASGSLARGQRLTGAASSM